jgi:hypothetical protein
VSVLPSASTSTLPLTSFLRRRTATLCFLSAAYLIAQVFVSSEQVMSHWIAVVFGVGQTCLQLFLGVARLD